MHSIDLNVPASLFKTQKWFASIITQPFTKNEKLPLLSPRKMPVEEEAKELIAPSPTLAPHQRIELYFKQYWWRLLGVLQENFPMVTRLFGYDDFNTMIGVPYLSKNPPSHWALCRLGDTLPTWIGKTYKGDNPKLVAKCAEIDWAAQIAFWNPKMPPLDSSGLSPQDMNLLLDQKIALQPHLSLFALQSDLFTFRDAFLKESVSYWESHPFPKLEQKNAFFMVFRNPKNQVVWQEIAEGESLLLSSIESGETISQALATLNERGGKVLEEAMTFLPLWFEQWTSIGLFCSILT